MMSPYLGSPTATYWFWITQRAARAQTKAARWSWSVMSSEGFSWSELIYEVAQVALIDGNLPVLVGGFPATRALGWKVIAGKEHRQEGGWEDLHDTILGHWITVTRWCEGQVALVPELNDQFGQFSGMAVEILANAGAGLTRLAPRLEGASREEGFGTSIVVHQPEVRGEGAVDPHSQQVRAGRYEALQILSPLDLRRAGIETFPLDGIVKGKQAKARGLSLSGVAHVYTEN